MIVDPSLLGSAAALAALALRATIVKDARFALLWTAVPLAAGAATLAPAPVSGVLALAAAVHLGLLIAKGAIERTTYAGRIAPFVLASSLCGAAAFAPWVTGRLPSPQWPEPLTAAALTAAWVALAYRLVSLRTERDLVKLAWLLPASALATLWGWTPP